MTSREQGRHDAPCTKAKDHETKARLFPTVHRSFDEKECDSIRLRTVPIRAMASMERNATPGHVHRFESLYGRRHGGGSHPESMRGLRPAVGIWRGVYRESLWLSLHRSAEALDGRRPRGTGKRSMAEMPPCRSAAHRRRMGRPRHLSPERPGRSYHVSKPVLPEALVSRKPQASSVSRRRIGATTDGRTNVRTAPPRPDGLKGIRHAHRQGKPIRRRLADVVEVDTRLFRNRFEIKADHPFRGLMRVFQRLGA